MTHHRAALALSCFMLVACASKEPVSIVTVSVGASDPTSTASILRKRLSLISGVAEPELRPEISGSTIRFHLSIPNSVRPLVVPVLSSPGELRLAPSDAPDQIWLSESDVVTATTTLESDSWMVSVAISKEAGHRLVASTSSNLGRRITISWNGRALISAPVRGPFGDGPIQFGPLSQEEAKIASLVLRTGKLPQPVTAVSVAGASN
jgi:hypothetical protein